jgi:hypothetical protein
MMLRVLFPQRGSNGLDDILSPDQPRIVRMVIHTIERYLLQFCQIVSPFFPQIFTPHRTSDLMQGVKLDENSRKNLALHGLDGRGIPIKLTLSNPQSLHYLKLGIKSIGPLEHRYSSILIGIHA